MTYYSADSSYLGELVAVPISTRYADSVCLYLNSAFCKLYCYPYAVYYVLTRVLIYVVQAHGFAVMACDC